MMLAPLLALWLAAQAPAPPPAEVLQQAKALWSTQGDREGASAKLEQVIALLSSPQARLDAAGRRTLCEAYNWIAVLEDRSAAARAQVPERFKAILDLDPDFVLDKAVTPGRLGTAFEALRQARFGRLDLLLQGEGGSLSIDGSPVTGAGSRHLAPGPHRVAYQRPGFKPLEQTVELAAGEIRPLTLTSVRVASTLRFHTHPAGSEIYLDGRMVGRTSGKAGPEARPFADKLQVPLEELSEAFLLPDLLPGKHVLEVRHACFTTRRYAIGEDFTSPLADHVMDPIKLESSKGRLTVTSPWKGGEATLDGEALGPLPVNGKPACSGTYTLSVRFPGGGFTQRVEIGESKALEVIARPHPRLAFLGIENSGDFPGRARIESQLLGLVDRLREVAFLVPRAGETPEQASTRIREQKEAELVLRARSLQVEGLTLLELRLSTLDGFEERLLVKPLDQDPLEALVKRLGVPLPLFEAGLPCLALDLAGEAGPWVLRADEAARKAGLIAGRPITHVNGRATPTVAALRLALPQTPMVQVTQQGQTLTLPVLRQALELPLDAPSLSYPRAIAELRLAIQGAEGDVGGYLRLNLGRAYLHYGKPDRALEILREATLSTTTGVSRGTLDYLMGLCLTRLGSVYIPDAIQAFNQALKYPGATLMGPDGPRVEPLAKAALQDLQP